MRQLNALKEEQQYPVEINMKPICVEIRFSNEEKESRFIDRL